MHSEPFHMPHSRARVLMDARIPVSQKRIINVPVAAKSGTAMALKKMSMRLLIGFFNRCAESQIKKKINK